MAALQRGELKPIGSAKSEWFDEKERRGYTFVREYFKEHGELPSLEVYLDKFKLGVPGTLGRPGFYLRELKNRHISTSLTSEIPKIMAALGTDPTAGLTQLQETIGKLKTDTFISRDVTYSDVAKDRFKAYQERVATKGVVHLSTGVDTFDKTFYGYRSADLITIGGRSGIGKSWLLIYLALQLEAALKEAAEAGTIWGPILFITNEMPEDEIIERVDCLKFKLPYADFMDGTLKRVHKIRYKRALEKLEDEGSFIRFHYNCSTIEELNILIDMHEPCLVVLDGSYLMEQQLGEGWEKITFITRNLKSIAKSKRTPIINSTQLRRATGKGSHKMSIDAQDDFAYSQSYTMDSDIALRMYQTADMVFNSEIGIEVAKGRRIKPNTRYIFTNNLTTMEQTIVLEEEHEKTEVVW